ncbi:MAG: hypothetical protein B7Z74_09385 [Deltaproteobacteria bacterium 21-66-5]|nr:MAG: hypothetical protein B7Z74_09385 [Deltaproteobacteria bacterium 21-66-5]
MPLGDLKGQVVLVNFWATWCPPCRAEMPGIESVYEAKRADGFTVVGVSLDDKPLKEIIRGLYYPDSPYEFSVLPAEILGQVYEQFLGKVIRLTAGGHRAVVEDKPEVKKAGGVFYTPAYIVDYIVRETVGKLVEGNTPRAGLEAGISAIDTPFSPTYCQHAPSENHEFVESYSYAAVKGLAEDSREAT